MDLEFRTFLVNQYQAILKNLQCRCVDIDIHVDVDVPVILVKGASLIQIWLVLLGKLLLQDQCNRIEISEKIGLSCALWRCRLSRQSKGG